MPEVITGDHWFALRPNPSAWPAAASKPHAKGCNRSNRCYRNCNLRTAEAHPLAISNYRESEHACGDIQQVVDASVHVVCCAECLDYLCDDWQRLLGASGSLRSGQRHPELGRPLECCGVVLLAGAHMCHRRSRSPCLFDCSSACEASHLTACMPSLPPCLLSYLGVKIGVVSPPLGERTQRRVVQQRRHAIPAHIQ